MRIKSVLMSFLLWSTLLCGEAPVYKLLYSPPSNTGNPNVIFEASPGLFYGLGVGNGPIGADIFSITATGTFRSIYTFPAGEGSGSMVQDTNSLLYGAGQLNNTHTQNFYFSIQTTGQDLHEYIIPGKYPSQWGGLGRTVVTPLGQLYDLAAMASGNMWLYAFVQITETGQFTVLNQFSGSEGYPDPYGNLALGPDGNIYGVGTEGYNGSGAGFMYRFTPSGSYSQLYTFSPFPTEQASLGYPVIFASDGNLYGTFGSGGANNTGEIYELTPSGQFQVLASFPPRNAGVFGPETLFQAADGNLYGSTNSDTIFRYDMAAKRLTTAYQLDRIGSQGRCPCKLIEGMDGILYGAAPTGGNGPSYGAVFSLNIGLPKPAPLVAGIYPASGAVGQKLILWGNYLLGVTSVTFNGVPAANPVSTSVRSVLVSVPPEATTGPVTVTTANGAFTTTQSFTIQ